MEGGSEVRMNLDKFKNPRKLLNAWEAQALATLTSKGLPNSFKALACNPLP